MGFLQNLMEKKRERNRQEDEIQQLDSIHRNIQRKKLSHNEREMVGILQREKEKNLSEALVFEEKRRKYDEMFREGQMFKGGFNLLE